MNLKELKLTENDLKLLQYLSRYKLMIANDAIYFYGTEYYQKRLQQLKNANYIKRYYRTYIKLTLAGVRFLEEKNIKCELPCRNKKYTERLITLSHIGLELEKSKIPFKLSWEMKESNYTSWYRRFLGEAEIRDEKYIVYNTKDDNEFNRNLHFDINKDFDYQNVLIITDSLNVIDKKNKFVFPNKVISLIVPINKLDYLKKYNEISIVEEIEKIYKTKSEYSDYSIAECKIKNKNIIYMPFIDTHKILSINSLFSLYMADCEFDLLTLEENIDKLTELISNEAMEKITIKILK